MTLAMNETVTYILTAAAVIAASMAAIYVS